MSLTVLRRSAIAAWLFLAFAPTAANAALLQQTTLLPPVHPNDGASYAALSGDGNAAAVMGAEGIVVFTRALGKWTREQVLVPAGDPPGSFGPLAMSQDGRTIVVGSPSEDRTASSDPGGARAPGAAFVFVRAADGSWSQQAKIPGSDCSPQSGFGSAVAISADASTIAVGAAYDCGGGSASIYRHEAAGWTLEHMLRFSSTYDPDRSAREGIGSSVALDGDGSTALVGSIPRPYVLSRGGDGTWSLQDRGPVPVDDWELNGEFGWDVALSADGRSALINGYDNPRWFTRPDRTSTAWTQLGTRLVPSGPVSGGVQAMALSRDGNTVLLAWPGRSTDDPGVAATYVRTPAGWAHGERFGGTDGTTAFGLRVAISGDGGTAIVDGIGNGPAVFAHLPAISAVTPGTGSVIGGAPVTLAGSDFDGATAVMFGTTPAASFHVAGPGGLRVAVPAAAGPSRVPITVVGPRGSTPASAAGTFNYVRPELAVTTTVASRAHPALRLGCAAVDCRGTASLVSVVTHGGRRHRMTLARGTFVIPAGRMKIARLRLTPAGRRLVARAKGRTLHVTARVVADGARPVSRRVALR